MENILNPAHTTQRTLIFDQPANVPELCGFKLAETAGCQEKFQAKDIRCAGLTELSRVARSHSAPFDGVDLEVAVAAHYT